jgi:diaminopimelate decarboxylase
MLDEGTYLDAASPGEIFLGLKAGFPNEKIMFTGTSVSENELEYAQKENIVINIDSITQLKALLRISEPKILSMRINPEVGSGHHEHVITGGKDSKFGIWKEDALNGYKTAKKAGVKNFGIHMHIGSGILKTDPFISALSNFMEIVRVISLKTNIKFQFIDIGGGLGVPYNPDEKELDIESFASQVTSIVKKKLKYQHLGDPILCMEPGRYFVCDSTILLTKVNSVKKTPYKKFIGVDAGFNTLIRPAMYNSFHQIIIANKLNEKVEEKYDIVGPLCESGDFLGKSRRLPSVDEGDTLAILNAGAYGFSMSSHYNSRPRPAEIMVKNGDDRIIRERENFENLLTGQRIAT